MKNSDAGGNWFPARFAIAAGIIGIIALLCISVYGLWVSMRASERKESPVDNRRISELPPPQDLERAVAAINDRLTQSKILAEGVRIEGRTPSARLTIAADHPNYYFKASDYTIETGGNLFGIPTAGLCKIINKIEQEKNSSILEALDRIDIEAELGSSGAALKTKSSLSKYFEVWYAIQQFGKIPKRKAEILLKGYADGQKSQWTRDLKPEPYRFARIPVLFPIESELNSYNPVTFMGVEKVVTIPDQYSNGHLPDLRAAFFKKDFIAPFLDECWSVGSVDVYIVKGYELKHSNPKERRVDVQVNLY